jgi:hypothetical protein
MIVGGGANLVQMWRFEIPSIFSQVCALGFEFPVTG